MQVVRRLAREHGLPLEEVRTIIRRFREAGCVVGAGSSVVSQDVLARVLAAVRGVSKIQSDLLTSAWQALVETGKGEKGDEGLLVPLEAALDALVKWYAAHMSEQDSSSSSDKFSVAVRLSREHSIPLADVETIFHAFSESPLAGRGGPLSKEAFAPVLARVAGVAKAPQDMFASAWRAMTKAASRTVSETLIISWEPAMDAIVEWYVTNIFRSEKDTSTDAFILGIARDYGIPLSTVEKVKQRFQHFDLDGNNSLDYTEFKKMCAKLMNAKNTGDIAEPRIKRWFKEADADSSGVVSFEEFVLWYLKYFNPDNEGQSGLDVGPIGLFYGSHDPQVQRRSARRASTEKFGGQAMQALSSW
jgi:hypothetical protein